MEIREIDALRLKKGDVLVLRPRRKLSSQELDRCAQMLSTAYDATGVKMIFLDSDIEPVAVKSEE